MPVYPRVLVLGQNTTLLETRSRILELAGYQVSSVLEMAVAETAISSEPFDLNILCNTLSSEQRRSVLTSARLVRPTMKTLILVDDRPMDFLLEANEATFNVFEGPRALLTAVGRMLGR
jgi:DNA-binding response OmpR family regulator